jgi:hypothetical protein
LSPKCLASACACAQRLQLTLEGLGAASNLLLLTGVGASFVVSYLPDHITNGGVRLASNEMSRRARFGFADSLEIGAELP